ncbi:unnamed protein product, partial [Mesorhabditis spiculigera]
MPPSTRKRGKAQEKPEEETPAPEPPAPRVTRAGKRRDSSASTTSSTAPPSKKRQLADEAPTDVVKPEEPEATKDEPITPCSSEPATSAKPSRRKSARLQKEDSPKPLVEVSTVKKPGRPRGRPRTRPSEGTPIPAERKPKVEPGSDTALVAYSDSQESADERKPERETDENAGPSTEMDIDSVEKVDETPDQREADGPEVIVNGGRAEEAQPESKVTPKEEPLESIEEPPLEPAQQTVLAAVHEPKEEPAELVELPEEGARQEEPPLPDVGQSSSVGSPADSDDTNNEDIIPSETSPSDMDLTDAAPDSVPTVVGDSANDVKPSGCMLEMTLPTEQPEQNNDQMEQEQHHVAEEKVEIDNEASPEIGSEGIPSHACSTEPTTSAPADEAVREPKTEQFEGTERPLDRPPSPNFNMDDVFENDEMEISDGEGEDFEMREEKAQVASAHNSAEFYATQFLQIATTAPPPPPPPPEPQQSKMPEFQLLHRNDYRIDCKDRSLCDYCTCREGNCTRQCINWNSLIQCPDGCQNPGCTNNFFRRRRFAAVQPFDAGAKGWGVRAEETINPGQFIMEYVGDVIGAETVDRRLRNYEKEGIKHHYVFAAGNGVFIDSTKRGNMMRFVNHSCNPNAVARDWFSDDKPVIGFFATRTILPGEEITFNYRFSNNGEPQKCYCGADNCQGIIGSTRTNKSRQAAGQDAPNFDEGNSSDEEVDDDEHVDARRAERRLYQNQLLDQLSTSRVASEMIDDLVSLLNNRSDPCELRVRSRVIEILKEHHGLGNIAFVRGLVDAGGLLKFGHWLRRRYTSNTIGHHVTLVERIELTTQILEFFNLCPLSNFHTQVAPTTLEATVHAIEAERLDEIPGAEEYAVGDTLEKIFGELCPDEAHVDRTLPVLHEKMIIQAQKVSRKWAFYGKKFVKKARVERSPSPAREPEGVRLRSGRTVVGEEERPVRAQLPYSRYQQPPSLEFGKSAEATHFGRRNIHHHARDWRQDGLGSATTPGLCKNPQLEKPSPQNGVNWTQPQSDAERLLQTRECSFKIARQMIQRYVQCSIELGLSNEDAFNQVISRLSNDSDAPPKPVKERPLEEPAKRRPSETPTFGSHDEQSNSRPESSGSAQMELQRPPSRSKPLDQRLVELKLLSEASFSKTDTLAEPHIVEKRPCTPPEPCPPSAVEPVVFTWKEINLGHQTYYFNKETLETSWEPPVPRDQIDPADELSNQLAKERHQAHEAKLEAEKLAGPNAEEEKPAAEKPIVELAAVVEPKDVKKEPKEEVEIKPEPHLLVPRQIVDKKRRSSLPSDRCDVTSSCATIQAEVTDEAKKKFRSKINDVVQSYLKQFRHKLSRDKMHEYSRDANKGFLKRHLFKYPGDYHWKQHVHEAAKEFTKHYIDRHVTPYLELDAISSTTCLPASGSS